MVEFRQIICWMSGKHYYALVNTFCSALLTKYTYISLIRNYLFSSCSNLFLTIKDSISQNQQSKGICPCQQLWPSKDDQMNQHKRFWYLSHSGAIKASMLWPQVIKLFSCSTQLSTKIQLLTKTKITIKEKSVLL